MRKLVSEPRWSDAKPALEVLSGAILKTLFSSLGWNLCLDSWCSVLSHSLGQVLGILSLSRCSEMLWEWGTLPEWGTRPAYSMWTHSPETGCAALVTPSFCLRSFWKPSVAACPLRGRGHRHPYLCTPGVQPWLSALLAGKCAQSYLLSHGLFVGSCTSNFKTFFLVLWMSLFCAVYSFWGVRSLPERSEALPCVRSERVPSPSFPPVHALLSVSAHPQLSAPTPKEALKSTKMVPRASPGPPDSLLGARGDAPTSGSAAVLSVAAQTPPSSAWRAASRRQTKSEEGDLDTTAVGCPQGFLCLVVPQDRSCDSCPE